MRLNSAGAPKPLLAATKTAHAYIDWFSVLIRRAQSYSTGYGGVEGPKPLVAHTTPTAHCEPAQPPLSDAAQVVPSYLRDAGKPHSENKTYQDLASNDPSRF